MRTVLSRLGRLALGFLVLAGLASSQSLSAASSYNFILILVDDMGWTDLGCYGSPFYKTPNIDRLAKEGLRFTQAYSACTVCSPTRAAVLTGRYPARLHVTDWIEGHKRPKAKLKVPDWTMRLEHSELTIAEALKPAGYASFSVGKWHLGGKEYYPETQGFDVNVGGTHRGQPPSYFSPYKIETLADGPTGEFLTDRECQEACRLMEANRAKPFFLYLPHYAVHTPLMGKSNVVAAYKSRIQTGSQHTNATYAALVESVDDSVGKILQFLEKSDLADRTVIIFTSDNGGLIGPTRNPPLRAGKGSAYEGGVRVPLIVKWPGVTKAGSESTVPVMSIDFFPTLMEIAGVKPQSQVDGKSLVPVLRGGTSLDRPALYWHYPHYHPGGATPYGAVRDGDYRLVEFFEDNRVELYNLAKDIGEKTDLATTQPGKADALRKQLHAWRKSVGAQMPSPNPDYQP